MEVSARVNARSYFPAQRVVMCCDLNHGEIQGTLTSYSCWSHLAAGELRWCSVFEKNNVNMSSSILMLGWQSLSVNVQVHTKPCWPGVCVLCLRLNTCNELHSSFWRLGRWTFVCAALLRKVILKRYKLKTVLVISEGNSDVKAVFYSSVLVTWFCCAVTRLLWKSCLG